MKIAVITRHAITNYGSLLQAMATQKVIEELGHSCEIIDYIRKDESYFQYEATALRRKPNWYNHFMKRTLYLALRQPESIIAGIRFEKARKKYLAMTRRYTSAEQLLKEKPLADVYMTGSDQVWGPVVSGEYDNSYCLGFTADSDKRISYAASFGWAEMEQNLTEYYKKWLSRYHHIAVREDKAVSILEGIGIQACQVLDPTFLITAADWEKYTVPIPDKKYVLVYQLGNTTNLSSYARKIAQKKGLKLLRISPYLHQISRAGKLIWLPNPGQFLSYIKNAECMVTDSFHGTAFAINFNTPFVEVLPNNNTKSRNTSILNLTGLSDRILKSEEDTELADKPIDFMKANQILAEERLKSLAVLKEMIER